MFPRLTPILGAAMLVATSASDAWSAPSDESHILSDHTELHSVIWCAAAYGTVYQELSGEHRHSIPGQELRFRGLGLVGQAEIMTDRLLHSRAELDELSQHMLIELDTVSMALLVQLLPDMACADLSDRYSLSTLLL